MTGDKSHLIARQGTLKVDHPERQRQAQQDELWLSGEWQLQKLGDLVGHDCCTDKQDVGNVAIYFDWGAADNDATGSMLNMKLRS